jgi:hypothetical protein
MRFSLCIAGLALAVLSAARAQTPPVADFTLPDVNLTSLRHRVTAADLSPRQYIHQVTAWYFGNEG